MSMEARTIRPFTGLELFEEALDGATLHFGQDPCLPGDSIYSDLDAHSFGLRPVDLEWAKSEDEFRKFKDDLVSGSEDLEIDPFALSLVVTAQTAYLKEANILLNLALGDISSLDRVTKLASSRNARPAPFKAWRHGFEVNAYIVLNQSIDQSPLRPWRHGTWLAKSSFEIKTTHSGRRLFRPLPLDDNVREEYGLPEGTARFVNFGDHDPLRSYDEQAEEPEFYIDADLLSELNASPASSASSKAVQLDLALHFISTTVRIAHRRLVDQDPRFEDLSGSLVARVLQLCAGSAQDREGMKQVYREMKSRPELVIARAENRLGIRKALFENVKGTD